MTHALKLILTIIITAVALPAFAFIEIESTKLTSADGLSNNSIRHVYQDKKGFIWMSSQNGLNRYDGNSFRIFRAGDKDEITLADDRIKYVEEDADGFLWISTSANIYSCYDLKNERFVDYTGCGEYKESYSYIMICDDCVWLWGRSNGCRRVRYENGTFSSEKFSRMNGSLKSDYVNFISDDKSGNIWIGTEQGLYLYDGSGLKCVEQTDNYHICKSNEYGSFFITSDGNIKKYQDNILLPLVTIPNIKQRADFPGEMLIDNLWIIFTSSGAVALNTQTEQIQPVAADMDIAGAEVIVDKYSNYWLHNGSGRLWHVDKQTKNVRQLELIPADKRPYLIKERFRIIHDCRDIVWITTNCNGFFAYEPKTDEIQHFPASDYENVFPSGDIQCLFEDNNGNIWMGSPFSGITSLRVINNGAVRLYPESDQRGDKSDIRLITALGNGNIFVSNRSGELFEYTPDLKKQISKLKYDSNIYALQQDSLGRQWVASRNGGLYIGALHMTEDIEDPCSLSSNQLFSVLKDSRQRIWIGSLGEGLNLAQTDKRGRVYFRHFLNDSYGKKRIRAMYEDRNKMIWCGTSEGIVIFNPDEIVEDSTAYICYSRKNSSLASDEIRHIASDSDGNIWIAAAGAGIVKCTAESGGYDKMSFETYGTSEGLVNDMVQAIIEDDNKDLWITTEYGVSRFDRRTETFENYFFSSKIKDNIYSEGSVCKLRDGRIIMGSNNGLVVVNPDDVHVSNKTYEVVFTDLSVNGSPVSSKNSADILDAAVAYASYVNLKHYQNSIVVGFSAMDFLKTLPVKYSYKLEGYEDQWSTPSSIASASYKNIKPGKYRLCVKACNTSGQWSSRESVLNITVHDPIWNTNAAYIAYFLVLLLIIYIAYRIIHNVSLLRNKVAVEKQLTEHKLRFFTNISHEFRTPLTLIQGALERMYMSGKIPSEMSYSVKVMDKSTRRMLRLVNELLEFRKMQCDKLALSLTETDVVSFFYEIFLTFKDVAESKKIEYRFITSHPYYKVFIDKGKIDKVLYNLLSNAFKYTSSGGKVSLDISVEESERRFVFKVTDTGIGIPEDKRDMLFRCFMQSNFSADSVGVGLHLSQELVSVHKGTIIYSENIGGGSVFSVMLPAQSDIYDQADFMVSDNEENASHLSNQNNINDFVETHPESIITDVDSHNDIIDNKRRILIIEDDSDVREYLKESLSAYFDVTTESDGISGLETALKGDADLIVSDVIMHGFTGYQITSQLKSNFNTSHIPVILLTALDSPHQHIEGLECGADSYITKPFSMKLLVTSVMKLLEQRDLLRDKFSSDLSMTRSLLSEAEKDSDFIERLTVIIDKQISNSEFTADEFASMMAMGRTMFYRKVKGVTGYSPKEYLRIIRLKKAASLLLEGQDSIMDIALSVGISDQFYFSRLFKQHFGVSPTVYQKGGGVVAAE